jgi:hypothetical protein
MRAVLTRIWEGWKRFAYWVGERQATLIYSILYVALIGPIALARRPLSDPLQHRKRRTATFWIPRTQAPVSFEQARRQ